MANINVLSDRYATQEINDIFSEKGKNIMERELWIAVMKAQKDLGLDISSYDIEKYERAKNAYQTCLALKEKYGISEYLYHEEFFKRIRDYFKEGFPNYYID